MKPIQIGDIFTRLIVIEENISPPKEKKYAKDVGKWHRCMCSCKNHTIIDVPEMSLLNGSTKSCGCLRQEKARKQIAINRKKMIKNGNTTRPKSTTSKLTYDGKTKSLTEWANDIGITKQALSKRLKKMTVQEALTKEAKSNGNQTRNDIK